MAAAPSNPPRAPLERFALLVVIIMISITVIILNGWMVVAGGLPPPRTGVSANEPVCKLHTF